MAITGNIGPPGKVLIGGNLTLEAGDVIEGDASVANVVDFVISGIQDTSSTVSAKALANGQLPATKGTLYTSPLIPKTATLITTIILVNTDSAARTVNLYIKTDGLNSRRLIPEDLSLEADGGSLILSDVLYVYSSDGRLLFDTGAGPNTFLGLADTPASYAGQADKGVKVNAAANALEFGESGELTTHAALTTAHGAVSTATASRIAIRDAAARLAVADGSAAEDAATKGQVDTHAALATGVHGVGASYVPLAPAASHLVRTFTKGWPSGYFNRGAGVNADPTEVFLPEFIKSWFHEHWLHDPVVAGTIWTMAFVGTGNRAAFAPARLSLATGATIDSATRLYTNYGPFIEIPTGALVFWDTNWGGTDRTTSTVLLFLQKWDTGVPPALTSHHVGFKIVNGTIWATNGDGTTEKATDTGITYTSAWQGRSLHFLTRSGAIDYFVGNVLVATHTENLPVFGGNGMFYHSITNEAAADRRFEIKTINLRRP